MSESGWLFFTLALGASGTIVAGTTGKKIRVLSAVIDVNNGSATWKFQSDSTDLTGNLYLSSGPDPDSTATGALVLPHNPCGWFETASGEDLKADLVAGSAGIGGCLTYELV